MTQRAIWTTLLLSLVVTGVLLRVAGLTLVLAPCLDVLACIVAGLGAGFLARREPDGRLRRVVVALDGMAALAFVALACSLASYCLARLTDGYVDPWLVAADSRFGFDWAQAYRFVASHPALQLAGRIGYCSIGFSPAVIVMVLAFGGRERAMRRFVFAFAATLWLTVALFPLFPARSALVHLIGEDFGYLPSTSIVHVGVIEALRGAQPPVLDPSALVGLITFPSFHASSAILFIWASWSIGALRYPMLLLNGAMLLATPVEGTHYLVDVVAGVVCALACIAVAERMGGGAMSGAFDWRARRARGSLGT